MCFWNTLIWNPWGSYPGPNSKRDSQNFVELYGFAVSRVESSQTGNSHFRLTRLSCFQFGRWERLSDCQVFRLAAEGRGEAEVVLICRHNEWRSAVSRGDKRSWRGRGESCSTDFFSDFSLRQRVGGKQPRALQDCNKIDAFFIWAVTIVGCRARCEKTETKIPPNKDWNPDTWKMLEQPR